MPNRLAQETSPYLLQHKDNPVDWYPWGPEAFERARAEDKPIFLSIGYSACHWCHVMERESFEDPETARLMNAHFVNIKVDREERPDVDAMYMDAVQALTGSGGWPMSVFLTPEGKPFYGGTYFPPVPRHGLPSFKQVLLSIAHAWEHQRDQIEEQARRLVDYIRRRTLVEPRDDELTPDLLARALGQAVRHYDPEWGGFGRAPKFPQPPVLAFLLRAHHRTGDRRAEQMLRRTLTRMARGGIYDQLGGGFHRYSVDRFWLVPHFEKMLYDNAQLARVYLWAWQAFGDPLYRRVVEETLAYALREMRHPEGGFYSAQDADSEGEEGKFFVWDEAEIDALLGPETAHAVKAFYAVSATGNWEGKNILWVPNDPEVVAHTLGMAPGELEATLSEARRALFEARRRRVPPATDTKVLTSWNALMVAAFAEAGRVLGRPDHVDVAAQSAHFLLSALRDGEGRLYHAWSPLDGRARVRGLLEDYAFLADALVTLYEATFDPHWLTEARALVEVMLADFWDAERGGFFDTPEGADDLIVRPKELVDNAVPAGNSAAALALLRLAAYLDDEALRAKGETTVRLVGRAAAEQPLGFANWLCALDTLLHPPVELALVGPAGGREPFVRVLAGRYIPHLLIAAGEDGDEAAAHLPILRGRTALDGRTTAYLCEQFTCRQPTTRPEELAAQLDALLSRAGKEEP